MAQGPSQQKKSFSVEDLNRAMLNRSQIQLTESELKRQLSQDLANNPDLAATVFNPPQIFSDDTVGVVVWSNAGGNTATGNNDNTNPTNVSDVLFFGAFDSGMGHLHTFLAMEETNTKTSLSHINARRYLRYGPSVNNTETCLLRLVWVFRHSFSNYF